MTPSSMLKPSPISTTLEFSSLVDRDCSVALILAISSFVMSVAVVGLAAYAAAGVRTDAMSRTFKVLFMVFLPDILLPVVSRLYIETIVSPPPDPEAAGRGRQLLDAQSLVQERQRTLQCVRAMLGRRIGAKAMLLAGKEHKLDRSVQRPHMLRQRLALLPRNG